MGFGCLRRDSHPALHSDPALAQDSFREEQIAPRVDFHRLSRFGDDRTALVSFSHVLFKAWINQFENKMKSGAQKLIVLVQNVKQTGSVAPKTGTDSVVARR